MKKHTALLTLFLCLFVVTGAFGDEQKETIKLYESYVEASMKAQSLEELKPYLSQNNINQMSEITPDDEAAFLEIMREVRSTFKIEDISSKVEGNKATLTAKGTDATDPNTNVTGIITLVKENGKWKLDNEDFTSEVVIESEPEQQ